jgi:hypothetical protein
MQKQYGKYLSMEKIFQTAQGTMPELFLIAFNKILLQKCPPNFREILLKIYCSGQRRLYPHLLYIGCSAASGGINRLLLYFQVGKPNIHTVGGYGICRGQSIQLGILGLEALVSEIYFLFPIWFLVSR